MNWLLERLLKGKPTKTLEQIAEIVLKKRCNSTKVEVGPPGLWAWHCGMPMRIVRVHYENDSRPDLTEIGLDHLVCNHASCGCEFVAVSEGYPC